MGALIQVCRALVQGIEAGALGLEASEGVGQRGFTFLQGGCEGGGALTGAGESIGEAVEARALLREGSLNLGNLRGEVLQRRDERGCSIPLSLERRRGSSGHLVELGDATNKILMAPLGLTQRALRAVARLVQLGDLFASDLPV